MKIVLRKYVILVILFIVGFGHSSYAQNVYLTMGALCKDAVYDHERINKIPVPDFAINSAGIGFKWSQFIDAFTDAGGCLRFAQLEELIFIKINKLPDLPLRFGGNFELVPGSETYEIINEVVNSSDSAFLIGGFGFNGQVLHAAIQDQQGDKFKIVAKLFSLSDQIDKIFLVDFRFNKETIIHENAHYQDFKNGRILKLRDEYRNLFGAPGNEGMLRLASAFRGVLTELNAVAVQQGVEPGKINQDFLTSMQNPKVSMAIHPALVQYALDLAIKKVSEVDGLQPSISQMCSLGFDAFEDAPIGPYLHYLFTTCAKLINE